MGRRVPARPLSLFCLKEIVFPVAMPLVRGLHNPSDRYSLTLVTARGVLHPRGDVRGYRILTSMTVGSGRRTSISEHVSKRITYARAFAPFIYTSKDAPRS